MVEGHYLPLQNLLREFASTRGKERAAKSGGAQAGSGSSGVSVIGATCTFLDALHLRLAGTAAADLATQVLDTLVELVQGPCHENQLTLINNKVGTGGCERYACPLS